MTTIFAVTADGKKFYVVVPSEAEIARRVRLEHQRDVLSRFPRLALGLPLRPRGTR